MTQKLPVQVFLVEDDEDDVFLFKDALKDLSLQTIVTVFSNGRDLCQHIQDSLVFPDIIFLDINMPLMNGKDCLKELSRQAKFNNVPIIMYSTSVTPSDINETFISGADLYVQKAFSFAGLQSLLQDILNRWSTGWIKTCSIDDFLYNSK